MSGYASTAPLASRIAIHRYGTNPQTWYAFVRALLPPADDVADVGAGTGALWAEGPRPARLVAVDSSAAMCAALRERGLPAVRAAADRLPFADAAFGGAVCNHVLYHLADPAAGLAELRRVVRPRGWVAVATNGRGHMAELNAVAVAAGLPEGDVHVHFPAERAAEAVAAAGFGEVETHRYDDTLAVPDAEPVVAYIASMTPRPLTPDEEAALRAAVTTTPFTIRKHTVLVVARR